MNSEDLHASLDELREEINGGELPPGATRDRINELISDIETKLESPDDEDHHDSMVTRLREAADQFRLEHPRAISMLNRVLVSLGEVGI